CGAAIDQDAFERELHRLGRWKAALAIGIERAGHDLGQRSRKLGPSFADIGRRRAFWRLLARQKLECARAEREQVRSAIDDLVARELGRAVGAVARQAQGLWVAKAQLGVRDAEIGDLERSILAHEQVLRRHVAMHDAEPSPVWAVPLVRVLEPLA